MLKNVLVLSGSPRLKGNSNILCDEFTRGAEESGHIVTRCNAAGLKIGGCLGCNACKRNSGVCVQKDAMSDVREQMLAADVIVLSSPIYFYSIAAQLKAVIDRTYAFEQELKGKTFYFMISCAAPDESYAQTMLAALRGYISCLPESREGGYVIGTGTIAPGDVRETEAADNAYRLGKNI